MPINSQSHFVSITVFTTNEFSPPEIKLSTQPHHDQIFPSSSQCLANIFMNDCKSTFSNKSEIMCQDCALRKNNKLVVFKEMKKSPILRFKLSRKNDSEIQESSVLSNRVLCPVQ